MVQRLAKLRDRPVRRFQRLNLVLSILIAGWVPVLLMMLISYTILSKTLETKILRDRQTFVQLIAHLVGDDLTRSGEIAGYYQTYPPVAKIFSARYPDARAREFLRDTYFAHPRIDGMFLTTADGRLLASVPEIPSMLLQDRLPRAWMEQATNSKLYFSPIHPRPPDGRMATDLVAPIQGPDGRTVGYVGVSVLVERIGRRLSSIAFADQEECQIVDQNGAALFGPEFHATRELTSGPSDDPIRKLRTGKPAHIEENGFIYSSAPVESTGWTTIVKQPAQVAYRPVHDLLEKMTILAAWLIVGTGVIAWLANKFYRRQREAAARIEREVIFNDKILANMPIGIALVDPETRRFLQANESFEQMARRFSPAGADKDLDDITYDEIGIAPADALDKVLNFGTPFQLVEHPLVDRSGLTNFVNINLLRLQGSKQTVQGALLLIEDKTRDVRQRQELMAASAAKDQFLALLSHELRNPLSPVIAMVGELEERAAHNPDLRHPLEVIRRNVELEARLIDDLLDVTRIEKGKLQLSFEVTSVHEALERVYDICREDIRQKNLKFEFRLNAEREYVNGDPARLQQVFWNLIKNAVKFTSEGGQIVVETENLSDHRIAIRTIDTGIGIESSKIDKIFNAFEQGQSSITRKFGGLGLGLAISKAMVRAHGGTISVESAGLGKGAIFTVVLNTVPAPAADEPVELDTSPGDREKSPARKGHLLVVDDHQDTCIGMKMLLERRGYRITLAHTAGQALEKAQSEKFDLLISDIGLPDRSGYELMKELRSKSSLPGIALSGFGMENDVNRARAAGFSQHLTKPINFDRLDEAIRSLLT
jgi:signal transduction histidine kinase